MKESKETCTRCGNIIIEYKTHPIVNWTNIEQPNKTYLFCSKPCKMVWLANRLEKSQEEKFICKYCGKSYDSKRARWTHEGRCKSNPKVLLHLSNKTYTMEDIREIDRAFGLTDEQIANFVRGKKR